MSFFSSKTQLPSPEDALPGREEGMPVAEKHAVLDAKLDGEFPGCTRAMFGMGCFWGAERLFWTRPGVVSTAVGYASGSTPNPTYREVCSGQTGHNEVVRVIFDPERITYAELLQVFFEGHDPTQGMRQGNDVGTQYRSGIYTFDDAQAAEAKLALEGYQQALGAAGFGPVTTELLDAPTFYFAEDYHQQYLAKNPSGYCGLGGTGISCPTP